MKRILFMGPLAPPFTGQSIAFTTVVKQLQNKQSKVVDISGKDTILSGIGLCIKITYLLLFYRFDRIYFTCSRSMAGSVRDLVLLFWARVFRIPVVNHLHGGDFKLFYDQVPSWYRKLVRWTYAGVNESIVLTKEMENEFSDFPDMKLTVVHNSYAAGLDDCPVEKPVKQDNRIRLVYLSNIMKMKGILHLLDAFEIICEQHDNVHLSIAGVPMGGSGCPKEEISNAFNDRYEKLHGRFPERINYLGVCSGDSKKQLLWESDVFVLPTFHPTEAFPISILEALRTGNYILTTRHRFIPSIVSEQNGCLIQPDSTDSIVSALHEIINHTERLHDIQNNNIRFVREKYGEQQYLDGIRKILAS